MIQDQAGRTDALPPARRRNEFLMVLPGTGDLLDLFPLGALAGLPSDLRSRRPGDVSLSLQPSDEAPGHPPAIRSQSHVPSRPDPGPRTYLPAAQQTPDATGPRDRGSGTIIFLALFGVAAVLMTVTLGLGLAVSTRHRAAAAADLAALAAIDSAEGCPAAARVAEANRARLFRCEFLADGTVAVSVTIDAPALSRPVLGSARAGPGPAKMASTQQPPSGPATKRTAGRPGSG